jgi:hypothetical protein
MRLHGRRAKLNLGNALLLVGVGVLGFSIWLPYLSAERTYRVEIRADRNCASLCQIVRSMPGLSFHDPNVQEQILTRLQNDRLNPVEPPAALAGKAFFFTSKHYVFMVTQTPPERLPEPIELPTIVPMSPRPGSEWRWPWRFQEESTRLPFEIYAWPASLTGPARTAFFYPSDTTPKFCHNLDPTYLGFESFPQPGNARRKLDAGRGRPGVLKAYRGFDGARWLLPNSDKPNMKNLSSSKR